MIHVKYVSLKEINNLLNQVVDTIFVETVFKAYWIIKCRKNVQYAEDKIGFIYYQIKHWIKYNKN